MTKKTKITKSVSKALMKQVREDVASYVKGKPNRNTQGLDHLGQYPTDMNVARRTIIALQDLLDKTMTKHKEASTRIGHLIEHAEQYDREVAFEQITMLNRIGQLEESVQSTLKAYNSLEKDYLELANDNSKLAGENVQLKQQLDAALTVIKTLQN